MDSVRWLVELATRADVRRIILNGSFIADIIEPGDVDCALLAGKGFPMDRQPASELRAGLPFLDIQIVRSRRFSRLVNEFFAADRYYVLKGMVEVIR
jgi:hypothetical protein